MWVLPVVEVQSRLLEKVKDHVYGRRLPEHHSIAGIVGVNKVGWIRWKGLARK
jgi:hypothetical protein